jgi:hypothetical protein
MNHDHGGGWGRLTNSIAEKTIVVYDDSRTLIIGRQNVLRYRNYIGEYGAPMLASVRNDDISSAPALDD